jgi:hypothetical protein
MLLDRSRCERAPRAAGAIVEQLHHDARCCSYVCSMLLARTSFKVMETRKHAQRSNMYQIEHVTATDIVIVDGHSVRE